MADEQGKTVFDLQTSPSHLLHRAQQAAVTASAAALSDKGLTLRQFAVLAALAREEGQSQARLVDMTGIDRSTLAEMVSRMEQSGHIKRVTSKEDARAKAVTLMAKGRKAYELALPAVEAADASLLEMIRANRRSGLLESLAQIGGATDSKAEEAPTEEPVEAKATEPAAPAKAKAKPKKAKAKPAKSAAPKPSKSAKAEKPAKAEKKPAKAKSDKKKKKKKK